jgi:hypothetical protein
LANIDSDDEEEVYKSKKAPTPKKVVPATPTKGSQVKQPTPAVTPRKTPRDLME